MSILSEDALLWVPDLNEFAQTKADPLSLVELVGETEVTGGDSIAISCCQDLCPSQNSEINPVVFDVTMDCLFLRRIDPTLGDLVGRVFGKRQAEEGGGLWVGFPGRGRWCGLPLFSETSGQKECSDNREW